MGAKLLLSSTLRRYIPNYNSLEGVSLEGLEGRSLKEVLIKLGIPVREVKVVMIDGIHTDLDYVLKGGERIALFPAVGGG